MGSWVGVRGVDASARGFLVAFAKEWKSHQAAIICKQETWSSLEKTTEEEQFLLRYSQLIPPIQPSKKNCMQSGPYKPKGPTFKLPMSMVHRYNLFNPLILFKRMREIVFGSWKE